MHLFWAFVVFSKTDTDDIDPFAKISHSLRMCGPLDSAMTFPNALSSAISMWNATKWMKRLSKVGFSSYWICKAIFAIARSYVTAIDVRLYSLAISHDLFIVSKTTEFEVGDSLICCKYHIFCCFCDFLCLREFQPTHNRVDSLHYI